MPPSCKRLQHASYVSPLPARALPLVVLVILRPTRLYPSRLPQTFPPASLFERLNSSRVVVVFLLRRREVVPPPFVSPLLVRAATTFASERGVPGSDNSDGRQDDENGMMSQKMPSFLAAKSTGRFSSRILFIAHTRGRTRSARKDRQTQRERRPELVDDARGRLCRRDLANTSLDGPFCGWWWWSSFPAPKNTCEALCFFIERDFFKEIVVAAKSTTRRRRRHHREESDRRRTRTRTTLSARARESNSRS